MIEAHSRFQALGDQGTGAKAKVTVSDHWWSLVYRDSATPECQVRSDWRPEQGSGDLADLAAALTRLIRTMSRAEARLAVTVDAAEDDAPPLARAIAARLGEGGAVQTAPPCDNRALALQAATA